LANHEATTTQSAHPWRATVRTIFAAVIALSALAPLIYSAAAQQSPELATGAVGGVLVAAGAITRIMAIPGVEAFLQRFLPFLSAAQRNDPNVTGEAPISEFDALVEDGKNSYPIPGAHDATTADPERYNEDQ